MDISEGRNALSEKGQSGANRGGKQEIPQRKPLEICLGGQAGVFCIQKPREAAVRLHLRGFFSMHFCATARRSNRADFFDHTAYNIASFSVKRPIPAAPRSIPLV